MNSSLKPSQIAMLAGGAVTLIFSFFAFVSIDFGVGKRTFSAWSTDANLFPLATWPAIFGLIVAGGTAAVLFGGVKLPENILGFTWTQWTFILSFASVVIMIGYLFANENKGFGYWLMLLGTLAYAAGALMEHMGIEPGGSSSVGQGPGSTPPSPF